MKNLFVLALLFCVIFSSFAQNTWMGGAPGRENDWLEARNWSNQRVPTWEDDVLIPQRFPAFYPVVTEEAPEIASLKIAGGATLTIAQKGHLKIDGIATYHSGVFLAGTLLNYGNLTISNTGEKILDGNAANLITGSDGLLFLDGEPFVIVADRRQ